jgi:hypothetical protein
MKLKMKNYVAPEAFLTRVCTESGICSGSKEEIVKEKNTSLSILKQDEGGEFTITGWE